MYLKLSRWELHSYLALSRMVLVFPDDSVIKNPPARQETRLPSLGQEYPLEKEMATHFSILAWEIPWTEELGRLQSMGQRRVRHNLATK